MFPPKFTTNQDSTLTGLHHLCITHPHTQILWLTDVLLQIFSWYRVVTRRVWV